MKIARAACLACICACILPPRATTQTPPDPDLQQQFELSQMVNDAGSSPIDVIRGLEAFLKKYPETKLRVLIEQTLAKAAMDANDDARIILYGEKALNDNATDDMKLIDRVVRALVDSTDPEQAKTALEYARRYETDVLGLRQQNPPGHLTPGQWSDEVDLAQARALALEARATGNAVGPEAAAKVAQKSWDTFPTGEGARELAYWLLKLDRTREAMDRYADAFTLEDARTTGADRAKDRKRLGELYVKLNGSEKGLGDLILQAYDRTSGLMNDRRARLQAKDPNAVATSLEEFVLPPVQDGAPSLALASLKGKIVVMDFWATWCVPCRAQKPIIEAVEDHFKDTPDIVFVAVDADDDPSLVAPFVKDQKWDRPGYFEAGLAQKLIVSAIPTVVVLDSSGHVYSRITGFVPDRFQQLLTERIEAARQAR